MPDVNYPSNRIKLWKRISLWGGAAAGVLTPDFFTWVNGILVDTTDQLIKLLGVPWSSHTVIVQEAVGVGDVLAMDLSRDATDADGNVIPYIGKYATIQAAAGTPKAIGLAIDTASIGGYCTMAGLGPIEARYTGLSPGQTGGTQMSVDLVTNKLKVKTGGEEVIAYTTPKGCVLFLGAARAA